MSFIENVNKIAQKDESVEIVAKAINSIDEVAQGFTDQFNQKVDDRLETISKQVEDALEVLYVQVVSNNGTVFKNDTEICKVITANLFVANILQSDISHQDYRYKWFKDGKPILVDAYGNMVTVYIEGEPIPNGLYFTDDGNVYCRSIVVCNGQVDQTAQFTVELIRVGE